VKLLYDHNLSPKLVRHLADLFPNSDHLFPLHLHEADELKAAICFLRSIQR